MSAWPRRLFRLAEVAGGAYLLYQGYKRVATMMEHRHPEQLSHSASRPRLAPTGLFRDRYFQNSQGLWIFKRMWRPTVAPVGTAFIVHGYGEHCGRYDHVAKALCEAGLVVFSMDHQGHGQSEGDRVHVLQFSHYVDDFLQYVRMTREDFPQLERLPRFLIGHSMGGAIAYLTARKSESAWTGVVFSGPAIKPDPKVATPAKRAAANIIASWLPKMELPGLGKEGVCSDPTVVQNYGSDPLVHQGGMKLMWGKEIIDALLTINQDMPKFRLPFLIVHGEADVLCDIEGSRDLLARASSEDKQLITYPELFHEVFNEPTRDRVLKDVTDWIHARIVDSTHAGDDG